MKVLVLGAGGQLGWELGRTCPPGVDLTALDVPDIDLSSHAGVNRCIDRFIHQSRWDAVINAAAYTAVDRADLMRTRPRLTVIDEQVGTPTWAFGLAEVIWKGIDKGLTGVFHYTDAGVASWYDFAVAIQEEALQAGLLETAVPILPISEADYPTPAQRPLYGVLDKRSLWAALDLTPIHWRVSLRSMLKELKETNP